MIHFHAVRIRKGLVFLALLSNIFYLHAGAAAEGMHNEITAYEGASTCLECHEVVAKEVSESLHYRLQAESKVVGTEKSGKSGFLVDLSPLYGTLASIDWLELGNTLPPGEPEGCGVCHVGLGAFPPVQDDAKRMEIDCLICHAPNYRRVAVKEKRRNGGKEELVTVLAPARDVDLLKAARQAQKPSTEMCRRCHDAAKGAGPGHGIPPGEQDVHFSLGLGCLDCHPSKKHQMPGGAEHRAQEMADVRVMCQNCHGEKPHGGGDGAQLNRHCYRIACQTCHSPRTVLDAGTPVVTAVDWSKPRKDEKSGRFYPAILQGAGGRPEYRWWDRSLSQEGEPLGSKRDRQAKIYPWRKVVCTVVVDSATGYALPLKRSVYSITGEVGDAAKSGAAAAGISYTGGWKTVQTTAWLGVNHQVSPKNRALSCDDCHANDGLNLKALGYRYH